MGRSGEVATWLASVSGAEWRWFVKRLSANDTGLTGAHQAGFYVPRELALAVAAGIDDDRIGEKRLEFDLVSHAQVSAPNLKWYSSKREFHVTGFGGRRSSLQDPDSTGSILATAWKDATGVVSAWLASTAEEEDALEAGFGPVDPGAGVLRLAAAGRQVLLLQAPETCDPDIIDLPARWAATFPSGAELAAEAARRRPGPADEPDQRLLERYRCEFGLFKVVEAVHTAPQIRAGFPSVDAFLAVAQPVANRRKARAGNSLELHLGRVFDEEQVRYQTHRQTEGNRTPDFIFPSIEDYHAGQPTRMLGAKTSVKERWRQVLDEAAWIPEKHLFTLSEGVSPDQFAQMEGAALRLVVPEANVTKFPLEIRPKLLTLAGFIALVR